MVTTHTVAGIIFTFYFYTTLYTVAFILDTSKLENQWQSLIVYKWATKRTFTHTSTHVLRAYHSNHDTYHNQPVIYVVTMHQWLIY